jgi:hypothetical protein
MRLTAYAVERIFNQDRTPMVEVEGSQEFEAWFLTLAEKDAEAVARVVGLLEEKGVSLGFPYTSDIKGSPTLRELRVQSRGHPLRVFYAFDPLRRAVLLWVETRPGMTGSMKPSCRTRSESGPST